MSNERLRVMHRKRVTFCAAYLAVTLAIYAGTAFAHGQEHHDGGHTSDAQMAKLHTIMQLYGLAQLRVETAFEKIDLKTAEKEIAGMIKTLPDLKKARPHKGLNHLEAFKKIAADFDTNLRQTLTLAKRGNLSGAMQAFSRAGQKCDSCHATFRD